MVEITVQTPRHATSSLQCGRNVKQTREHPVLHRPRGPDRTRKKNDEILSYEPGTPKNHLGVSLVRSITAKNRLGKRMDGLRPATGRAKNIRF